MDWFHELADKFSAGIAHCFVIHGNTRDYIDVDDNYHPIAQALAHLFKKRDAVIFYNRSAGWRFRNDKERTLVKNMISSASGQTPNPLAAVAAKDEFPKQPAAAIPMFEKLLGADAKIAVVVEYAESVFAMPKWDAAGANGELGTQIVSVLRWATDAAIASKSNPIILLCADSLSDLHPSLRSPEAKIEPIFIPYPKREERMKFIQWYLLHKEIDMDGVSPSQLANLTAGLALTMIEDILLRSQQMGGLQLSFVKERKDEIIAAEYQDVIEIVEPHHGWEAVGGLDYIEDFFTKNVIDPMANGDCARVPMGVLLPGPPGTGKSIIAEALAKESGVNMVKYSPGRSMGKFVGDSEKNTERVFRAIEAIAPCIVFIDELDKAVPHEDAYQGDSGVSSRILQRLQDFMSDTKHRGKIVFLGATNRPDRISAAMKRAGRFDKKIPVLAPNSEARHGVFKALFGKYKIAFKGKLDEAVKLTEGYVGADIEAIVTKSWEIAQDDGKTTVTEKHLAEAQDCMLPSVDAKQIEWMTALAIKECNDRSLLPPDYRKAMTREKVETVIAEYKQREGHREL